MLLAVLQKAELDRARLQLEREKAEAELALDRAKLEAEIALKREELAAEMEQRRSEAALRASCAILADCDRPSDTEGQQ